ncbi:YczE/YyaS/YitT family protein [Paratractidigestivibacter sp.]|uniref:YczE/YyaS/YitT family protein n=1 Tax=Paratractidigestivibacter sp. TaxID=2847316 RepID=UPI002AC923BB|nr:DUF6198 family protein [Paratractidigestivibacter sp.]
MDGFNTNNLGKRLFWFCLGLAVNSFGIALITKAGLGTSQISSIPYVLSFQFTWLPFAVGTFIMNLVFIVVQIVLMGRRFFPVQLLQIPVNIVFSSCLGVAMEALGWVNPTFLPLQVATLLAGCCVLGCGIAIECAPDLVFVPGEGIVYAIAEAIGKKLGSVKVIFDLVLVASSVTLSLVLFGELRGVGVGTIATVFITGNVVNFANDHFGFLTRVRALATA